MSFRLRMSLIGTRHLLGLQASNVSYSGSRSLHTQVVLHRNFYEKNKSGYNTISFRSSEEEMIQHLRNFPKLFVEECKKFKDEVHENFLWDPKLYEDGDTDVFFRFDSQDCLKTWRVASDKTNNEGMSECTLVVNDKGKGVFSGVLDTTPPKDGKHKFIGYCGMKTINKVKSFYREDHYDWRQFTHMELRVKGDGRNYMLNLQLGMYYDIMWFDMYSHPIFTHGGPYWQVVRIPFSKFFLTSKGRIQDAQQALPLQKIQSVGITAATVAGPFHLEIDYIGGHLDRSHKEKCAYELYTVPKEFVSA